MIMTAHARRRWAERMAGYDLDTELRSAKPPSKRLRRVLGGTGVPNEYENKADYLVSTNGVVFVTSPDHLIVVTVYFVAESKRRYRRKKRAPRSDLG